MTAEEQAVVKEHGLKTIVVDDDDIHLIVVSLQEAWRAGYRRSEVDELIERLREARA